MKFFFPDSQDQVDPSFDFVAETRSETRIRQRDDLYAHETFDKPPYSGILISRSMVDINTSARTRYTLAQRHRFDRLGVRRFFRLHQPGLEEIETMGDCGAFSYVDEEVPPYSPEDVGEFYDRCGFDYGVSVDHMILSFRTQESLEGFEGPTLKEWKKRQDITIALAEDFFALHKQRGWRFTPVGVSQGWSPGSYADLVGVLQEIGFKYIGLGGMVPMKTPEILMTLKAVDEIRNPDTQLHLFGISRCDYAPEFQKYGVASIDSTSPFRKAFKSAKDNYYTLNSTYSAIRVPQVDGNTSLKRKINAGQVNQDEARRLEQACLKALGDFDNGNRSIDEVLGLIEDYDQLIGRNKDRSDLYRDVLESRPWKECKCNICRTIGIHAILFRGSERNKRRGFHNLHVFYKKLRHKIAEHNAEDVPT